MKMTSIQRNRHTRAVFFSALLTIFLLSACNKTNEVQVEGKTGSNLVTFYSSEVIEKWMAMQVRLMKNATGIPNQAFSRPYAYSGIAAFESIAHGMPANVLWSRKWNGLTGLPEANPSMKYYWPANVNGALASMNRYMFPNASVSDKAAVDSLENALNQEFLNDQDASLVSTSSQFGKAVATAVFNWAVTDGYQNAGNAYTPPVGPGLWVPTPPALANASAPYWGNNRTVIQGSISNTQPGAPVSYSTSENSSFFHMVMEVYSTSQNLTDEQKAMAIFWRDVPGVTSPGHWLSILKQAVHHTNSSLGKAALAYALTGAAINDGLISCWKTKYQFNLVRPITYIRNVMGHATWNSFLGTPPHPEYSSAHAVLSSAAGEVFEALFGKVSSFTDHTYDYLGFTPRTYPSFLAIGQEAGHSRLYAGIHYRPSIEIGLQQGKKVAENILDLSPALRGSAMR